VLAILNIDFRFMIFKSEGLQKSCKSFCPVLSDQRLCIHPFPTFRLSLHHSYSTKWRGLDAGYTGGDWKS
jgi:hypothetical protein